MINKPNVFAAEWLALHEAVGARVRSSRLLEAVDEWLWRHADTDCRPRRRHRRQSALFSAAIDDAPTWTLINHDPTLLANRPGRPAAGWLVIDAPVVSVDQF
ncbi:hypothetical protein [Salinisphaera orenii]|uniref:hypothetical protein n=1 Tax=Salinisphaera orenii TaxID=856731 RepID=UPI000DBEA56F